MPAPVLPAVQVTGSPAVPTPVRATVPMPAPVRTLGVPAQLAPSVQANANATGAARPPVPVRPNNAPAVRIQDTFIWIVYHLSDSHFQNELKSRTQDRNHYGQFGFFQPNNFMYNYHLSQHLQNVRRDSMYPHHQLTFSRKRYNSILPSYRFAYHTQVPNPHIMNPLHR